MKLLFLFLFLSSPSSPVLAIPPAEQVRSVTARKNLVNYERQLPALLREIEEGIDMNSKLGFYSTTTETTRYNADIVLKAEKILIKKGYVIKASNSDFGASYLTVSWE